jgi:hypothetical protein
MNRRLFCHALFVSSSSKERPDFLSLELGGRVMEALITFFSLVAAKPWVT